MDYLEAVKSHNSPLIGSGRRNQESGIGVLIEASSWLLLRISIRLGIILREIRLP